MNLLDKMEDYDRLAKLCEKQAEEIEQLQKQIAMLLGVVMSNHQWHVRYDEFDGYDESELCEKNLAAINDTQAAADAFMAEHDAKVLENAAEWLGDATYVNGTAKHTLLRMSGELRTSANKITKGDE